MNNYIKIKWETQDLDMPCEIYSEVIDCYENRKIEIYKNGDIRYATNEIEVGTFLSYEKYPTFDEIRVNDENEQITPYQITQLEFEEVWLKHICNRADL